MDNDMKLIAGAGLAIIVLMAFGAVWSEYSQRAAWQSCTTTMKDKPAAEIIAVCGGRK